MYSNFGNTCYQFAILIGIHRMRLYYYFLLLPLLGGVSYILHGGVNVIENDGF